MTEFELNVDACRRRQKRLLDELQNRNLDLAIIRHRENVQWLTGAWFPWFFEPIAAISSEGHVTLVAPNSADVAAAADDIIAYEAQWHSTLRNDQRLASSNELFQALQSFPRRIGIDFASMPQFPTSPADTEIEDIEPALYYLRRRKEVDELAKIRKAIAGTQRMYERAREIIEPGISELEVFSQLQAAAVDEFGEPLTGTGNDYQCGSPGGPPRQGRTAEAGELYVLDLGPAFRGYFADNCRTIAVTSATDEQHQAWAVIMKVFEHVEQSVRPGKSARELFEEAQAILGEAPLGQFTHHLGHGIGLFPHEAPHLNPHWDDAFEVGDVFTAEPGLYAPALRVGMRIENNYRVTDDGVELLTEFSMEL